MYSILDILTFCEHTLYILSRVEQSSQTKIIYIFPKTVVSSLSSQ